jgi:SAM-dependent methyltransferase
MRTSLRLYCSTLFPNIRYIDKYIRGAQKLNNRHDDRIALCREFMEYCSAEGKRCLQIGVRGEKCGKNWVSVDRYDQSPLIDFHYDIRALEFPDGSFDGIVCNAILEHVEEPQRAIGELFRVLRPGGRIWVEVPLNQPYHPSPGDFWRVTPEGLRIWMSQFKERSCGGFFIDNSAIFTGVFFYGEKDIE